MKWCAKITRRADADAGMQVEEIELVFHESCMEVAEMFVDTFITRLYPPGQLDIDEIYECA